MKKIHIYDTQIIHNFWEIVLFLTLISKYFYKTSNWIICLQSVSTENWFLHYKYSNYLYFNCWMGMTKEQLFDRVWSRFAHDQWTKNRRSDSLLQNIPFQVIISLKFSTFFMERRKSFIFLSLSYIHKFRLRKKRINFAKIFGSVWFCALSISWGSFPLHPVGIFATLKIVDW